ncbi:MAG: F0F1 ATP synthase subunit delta [Chloroflexi bacterium]|nr:F0F1 ATP synthase subunit delta [Chloroflexota bacterium]
MTDRPQSLSSSAISTPLAGGPARELTATNETIKEAETLQEAVRPKVAEIRVATELYGEEMQQLKTTLERIFGGPLELRLILDPDIIGGVWVRVGDTVLDGTLRGQIEALRHHLTAQCRAMMTGEMTFGESEGTGP